MSMVLLLAVVGALVGLLSDQSGKAENTKVSIAVTGDTESPLLQLGLKTFQSIDETKYSLEILSMEEDQAREALLKGEIACYMVIPQDFVENAMYGRIDPVRFVTATGTEDVVALFKNELLQILTDLVILTHPLEKERATHSSILAQRIP